MKNGIKKTVTQSSHYNIQILSDDKHKTPLRYSIDSFVKRIIRNTIEVKLIDNEISSVNIQEKIIITGKEIIKNIAMDRIFLKCEILWLEVLRNE